MNGLRKKVLLVDDDRLLVMSFRDVIKVAGYELETAAMGMEAWEKLQKFSPHIVILDIVIPEMSGFEIARKMKSDANLRKIPILMLTGLRSPSDATDAKLAGADEVLLKPINPEKLLERIKFHINKASST
ncbi:MAG: PleD family two-component system response regulator [Bacteroidota bacterium]